MKNFRCYQLSIETYSKAEKAQLPLHLKKQFIRAASSIALNLAEGYGRQTTADRRHFFTIAFGSLRECQAICALGSSKTTALTAEFDKLGGAIYKLLNPK